jgi:hypothetical protein
MKRVKIFQNVQKTEEIEQMINSWLKNLENNGKEVEIVKVLQTSCGGNGDRLIITVFYKTAALRVG